MKTITRLVITTLLVSSFLVAGQAGAGDYGKQKVVYHINYDNPKQQAGALRNIQNHINAVGAENLDLKVVLHGNGLALLLEPDSLDKLKKFKHANADDRKISCPAGWPRSPNYKPWGTRTSSHS